MPDETQFGRLEIHPSERAVKLDGQTAALGARAFDLLWALMTRRDRTVGKNERAAGAPDETALHAFGAAALLVGLPRVVVQRYERIATIARWTSDHDPRLSPEDEGDHGGVPSEVDRLVKAIAEDVLAHAWSPLRARLGARRRAHALGYREGQARAEVGDEVPRAIWQHGT